MPNIYDPVPRGNRPKSADRIEAENAYRAYEAKAKAEDIVRRLGRNADPETLKAIALALAEEAYKARGTK